MFWGLILIVVGIVVTLVGALVISVSGPNPPNAASPSLMRGDLPASAAHIIGGPYEPKELGDMILTLGATQTLLHNRLRPALQKTWDGVQNFSNQLPDIGYDGFSQRLLAMKSDIETAYLDVVKTVYEDRVHSKELGTTMQGAEATYAQLAQDLSDLSDDFRPKAGEIDGVISIVNRRRMRIEVDTRSFFTWLGSADEAITNKIMALRQLQKQR
jgi:hypothetical protein